MGQMRPSNTTDFEEAIAEAQRRWGPSGAVSLNDQYMQSHYLVGELVGGRFWVRGRGSSFWAAFADADLREIDGSRRRALH
jgi:hypothetical protein